jgi:hypothetical protein
VGVSVVASATMIVGWHRFSDTIGAVALAAALCCGAFAAVAGRPPVSPRRGAVPPRPSMITLTCLPLLVLVLVMVGAAAAGLGPGLVIATVAAGGFTALSVASVLALAHSVDAG